MSELRTLSKSSPEFSSYLLGTFSKDKRALPVQTLNVNSKSETVTFNIVPLSEIERPPLFNFAFQIFKVKHFLLVLTPIFLVLMKLINANYFLTQNIVGFMVSGLILAFISTNLRNEYADHVLGGDRVLPQGGSRAIQNGWITAETVKKLSVGFLVLAGLYALPVILNYPPVVFVMMVAMILGISAQFQKNKSYKYERGGEFALYILLGPLLAVGINMAASKGADWQSLSIGLVWGLFVLFQTHLKNFLNIFPSSQAGLVNTINWLGFDNSRRLLASWWLVIVLATSGYMYAFIDSMWALNTLIVLALPGIKFITLLKNLPSSTGSKIEEVVSYGHRLYLLGIFIWVVQSLYLWMY